MKNITIILPVHKIDGDYQQMFIHAAMSVEQFYEDVKLVVVHPESITNEVNTALVHIRGRLEIETIGHTNPTDFISQLNVGLENVTTEWFSILEVDDDYKSHYTKTMLQYTKEYQDVSVFLPIVKDINVEGKFLSFTNEANWAYGFTNEQGFMDNEVLLDFQNYQISGGLYKTEVIRENGGFKDNIKLTFGYEFLLRLTNNGVKIMTVPRVMYQHVNFREDSLFWSYKNDETLKLEEDEVKFWLETAKKEYFFKNKRDVSYVTT